MHSGRTVRTGKAVRGPVRAGWFFKNMVHRQKISPVFFFVLAFLVDFGNRQPSQSFFFMFFGLSGGRQPKRSGVFVFSVCLAYRQPGRSVFLLFSICSGNRQPSRYWWILCFWWFLLVTGSPADQSFWCFWFFLVTGIPAYVFVCVLRWPTGQPIGVFRVSFFFLAEAVRPEQLSRSVLLVFWLSSLPVFQPNSGKESIV